MLHQRPQVSRRLRSLLLAAACALGGAALADDAAPLDASEVAPGVWVHTGRVDDWLPANGGDVANLSFVVGSRCVAVVDTGGTPQLGRRWRATVERTTRLPICYVVNTHAHPDHVLGNAAFAGPETRFVASASFEPALAARAPYFLHALERDFGTTVAPQNLLQPVLGVEATRELDLGDRVLLAQRWPTAHTDNDLTVYDRRSRTLIAGDLLFVQHLPVVDGSLRGWLKSLPQLAQLDAARIVPGHGPVQPGGAAAWQPEQSYLNALLVETRASIKSGRTLSQAVDSVGTEAAAPWQLVPQFHRRNVTAAFAELEWEE